MANTKSIDLELSSSQYLSITDGDQTGLDLSTDFTIEAWIKLESALASDELRTVVSKYGATTTDQAYYLLLFNSSGVLQLRGLFQNTNNVTFFTKDFAFATDTWYHVAMTADISAASIKLYIDGVDVSAGVGDNDATTINNSSTPFIIGARKETAADFFDGLIDDVRVWSDIRTASEISDNMSVELDGDEAGLVGYWKLNNSLLDETSNDNDLTNNNSATFSSDVPFVGAVRRIIMVE